MKDGWFNKFLGRKDQDEPIFNTKADEGYQGLLNQKGEGASLKKKERWLDKFSRFFLMITGMTLGDELEKRIKLLYLEFDDDWLMDESLENLELERKILGVNSNSNSAVYFEGQLYIPLEGTHHLGNLKYQMVHAN